MSVCSVYESATRSVKLAFLFCVTSEQFSSANYIIWYLIDSAEHMLVQYT